MERRSTSLEPRPCALFRALLLDGRRADSLPINRDCQQTAKDYYCIMERSRAYTEHESFLCVSQATQTIYESPTARAVVPRTSLFGRVESALKSVFLSDSKVLLSILSVNGVCCTRITTTRVSVKRRHLLRSGNSTELYSFQYVAVVVFLSVLID